MKLTRIIFVLLSLVMLLTACDRGDPSGSTGKLSEGTSETESNHEQETSPAADEVKLTDPNSIFRFLSDINNGQLLKVPDEPDPPGTLSPVENIPQPEQDLVGTVVSISFDKPASQQYDHVSFHYLHNAETGEETTVVIFGDVHFPMLMVLKTQFGSANVLLNHVQQGTAFQGKILAMVNLDPLEGVYSESAVVNDDKLTDGEVVDLLSQEALGGSQYIGYYSSYSELRVKGICGDAPSEGLEKDLAVYWRIYERFGLKELLAITNETT